MNTLHDGHCLHDANNEPIWRTWFWNVLIFFKRKTWCNSGMVCFWVHKFTTADFVRSIYPNMITIDHGNIKTLGKHRSNDGVFPVASTNFGVPTEIPRRPGFQPWQVTMPLSDGRI